MDMIRWLATNKVVVTVWGLGLFAMLLSLIFGGGDKAEHETVVETLAEASKPEVKVETAAAVAKSEVKVEEVVKSEVKVEEAAEVVKSEVKAVVATAAVTTAAAVSVVKSAVDVKAESVKVAVDSKAADVSGAKKETSVDEAVDVKSSLADKSSDDLLMMAREAYWDNDLDEAAGLYSELIAREPNTIEHKGELGNVFWRQGYPKKAAGLYAEIAEPMIAEGNGERVSNMVGFISLFFPERAANIRKQLDAQ